MCSYMYRVETRYVLVTCSVRFISAQELEEKERLLQAEETLSTELRNKLHDTKKQVT